MRWLRKADRAGGADLARGLLADVSLAGIPAERTAPVRESETTQMHVESENGGGTQNTCFPNRGNQ